MQTIELLDRESGTYELDLLSIVESILDNPDVVLFRQLDRLKREKLAELKAQGVEYEERIVELDKLTHPKPNADFAYDTFNAFAKRHPWVRAENIRPKSVAREMYETFSSFGDYVKDHGLERSEGLVLRYLSEMYKTLVHTVPVAARTAGVDDVITFFGAMLKSVDSSLIDEWERLLSGGAPDAKPSNDETSVVVAADRVDITKDTRQFVVLIRNALFSVLRALARREYDRAAALLEPGDEVWTPRRLETALEPFFDERSAIRLDPAARAPTHTRIVSTTGPIWPVEQIICDPDDANEWALFCRVDVDESRDAGHPVVLLDRIGP
jgi:hypothetical protein